MEYALQPGVTQCHLRQRINLQDDVVHTQETHDGEQISRDASSQQDGATVKER